MDNLEILLFFHPMPPDPDAKLATIGLRLFKQGELFESISLEVARHSVNGMFPGYWSESRKTWFIDPGIWACIHNLLVNLGCAPGKNEDPQWILYKLKGNTKDLACSQHYFETILWHLLTTERNLKAWEEKVRMVELFSQSEGEEAKRLTDAWVSSERGQIERQYRELEQLKQDLSEITNKTAPPSEDWLDAMEDKIEEFYKRFD
jgi:hypothetical protein